MWLTVYIFFRNFGHLLPCLWSKLQSSLPLFIEFRRPQRSKRISNCAVNLRHLAAATDGDREKCLRNGRFDEFLLKGEGVRGGGGAHKVEVCVQLYSCVYFYIITVNLLLYFK